MEKERSGFEDPENGEINKDEKKELGSETGKDNLSLEQTEQAEFWLKKIEEEKEAKKLKENLPGMETAESKIERVSKELEVLFDEWLVPEKLDPLHAVETMTPAEAEVDPERIEAKSALAKIVSRMNAIKDLLPEDEKEELKAKYKSLSQAVGMINGGKVDHTR